MPLELYNTLTRAVEPFVPGDPARVTFYSCGPTVYDDAHIGNFRSFLAADLLRRWIESPLCELTDPSGGAHAGPREVVHVMNITDVGHMTDDASADGGGEDKMEAASRRLLEAKKSGKLPSGVEVNPDDPYAVAEFYAGRFIEDAKRLGLKVAIEAEKDPSLMPRPTRVIEGMIRLVQTLIERGHAYAVGDSGDQVVYFDVQSFPAYGALSGNTIDNLRAGAGGRVDDSNQQQKRHPADFLLWKADDTHLMKWDSPWGAGYPGWHLECSVMAGDRLGEVIDLHSGGEDNIFPHHECELAQSCAATGESTFSRMWFHPRYLLVDGEKMSKSKGTFLVARDLLANGLEPGALRLELTKTHYRSNASYTEQGLKDSQRLVDRWRRFRDDGRASADAGSTNTEVRDSFAEAMHDDLNVARALGVLNKWIGDTGSPTKADAALMDAFDAVLGVLELEQAKAAETSIGIFADGLDPDPKVIEALERRRDARASKDFAAADAIRDELSAMGYAIKDAPGGKVEVRRA